jgi:hypothetical protein
MLTADSSYPMPPKKTSDFPPRGDKTVTQPSL